MENVHDLERRRGGKGGEVEERGVGRKGREEGEGGRVAVGG